MHDISYRPLIEDMTWSYSRITCFEDCPYKWFLKYIKEYNEAPRFYSTYGAFMHKIIEGFYRGEFKQEEMVTKFLFDFQKEVRGDRPQESTVNKYIQAGVSYLQQFKPFPYNMVDVEKKVDFTIDGIPFKGFIDYLGEKDGELYIVDNKSRNLQPRRKSGKKTAKDIELDNMLRQLYLYAAAVKQEYGKFPKALCFNCFRSGVFIEEPFSLDAYTESVSWAKGLVESIMDEEDFSPNIEYFGCYYICGVSEECCYWNTR